MSNLIPEPRTDKNGVTSTKWIKPIAATTQPRSLPAPSVAVATPAARAKEAVQELESLGYDLTAYPATVHNLTFIAEHDPFLFDQTMQNARATDTEGLRFLGQLMGENTLSEDNDWDEDQRQRTLTAYYRVCRNLSISSAFNSLTKIDSVAYVTENALGMTHRDEDISRAQALMIINRVTGESVFDIADDQKDDIAFIANNLEKVIPLIPDLLMRQDASRGLIEALWTSQHSALNDGIL